MKIVVTKTPEEMGKEGALIIRDQIKKKPNSVLGLATGSTPIPLYKELVRMHREGGLDFSKVVTFNLDEYINIPEDDINSYHYFMKENLFDHINLLKENIHVPDGNVEDIDTFAEQYEQSILDAGGLDLQLLGIGENGHIGFNEPSDKLMTKTGRVILTPSTIHANARFFSSENDVPLQAVTMGMKTILSAKKIVVIASGVKKHWVVSQLIGKEFLSTQIPVSFLFLHPDCTLIVDQEAYSGEKRI